MENLLPIWSGVEIGRAFATRGEVIMGLGGTVWQPSAFLAFM